VRSRNLRQIPAKRAWSFPGRGRAFHRAGEEAAVAAFLFDLCQTVWQSISARQRGLPERRTPVYALESIFARSSGESLRWITAHVTVLVSSRFRQRAKDEIRGPSVHGPAPQFQPSACAGMAVPTARVVDVGDAFSRPRPASGSLIPSVSLLDAECQVGDSCAFDYPSALQLDRLGAYLTTVRK
jgi:hypothetical protein